MKLWLLVHKWSSLVCMLLLLLLCITGLPLIFYEEIFHLTNGEPEVSEPSAGATPANLDRMVEKARVLYPGEVPLFLSWDDHAPIVYVTTGPSTDADDADMHTATFDAYSGQVVSAPQFNEGVMYFIFRLHYDLFLGLPGTLFLGGMGLLFAVSIVSGAVVYGPFMRKLDFGTIRTRRKQRVRWLDLHNLTGAVTLAWAMVVGVTGIINTLAEPLQAAWQRNELLAVTQEYQGRPAPMRLASIDAAVADARQAAPDMTPSFVSYPGTGYSGDYHYGIYVHGATPLAERLHRPVLIDATTGEVTGAPDLPWYLQALLLSQPLHFGDYGGLPLKIIWALLDIATILVLVSGLYLWVTRSWERTGSAYSALPPLAVTAKRSDPA